ncbi:MAG: hypothetical protein HY714_03320 [Candidatus Omnitrophica bacterium]|nr:hypothetical protein [Candidatus Omnitrophota bacterium]
MALDFEKRCLIFGRWLYFFAAYTVTIKYLLPVLWAASKGMPLTTYVYFWDAWWIAHLAVGAGLIRRKKGIWFWAFLLTAAEIIIIVVKFVFYLQGPELTFWHLNWFVNKSFLLAYFTVLGLWLMRKETRDNL